MAVGRGEQLRHLFVENTATAESYRYPRIVRGGNNIALPPRDRQAHGQSILSKVDAARSELEQLQRRRQAVGITEDRGIYLEFASDPGFELAFQSLDRERQKIELVAIRERGDVQLATVYVPEGKLVNLTKLVTRYIEEDKGSGKPKNQSLVESISDIRRAALESFWTDEASLFPAEGDAIWWEVWLRAGSDSQGILADFRSQAKSLGLETKEEVLFFPDRTVLLAYGAAQQMSRSVELLDCIAELRRAKEPPSFYTSMSAQEQMAWVRDLLERTQIAQGKRPTVCILDTGVNRGHPLLRASLAEKSLLTYDPDWRTADHAGHGTEMAGIALYGDLTEVLSSPAPVVLEHQLESVKLLPPQHLPANDPELYGAITKGCATTAEQAAPERARVFCMAVTTRDYRDRGAPSSWSAEVDQLCAGVGDGQRRLVFISAGNVDSADWRFYPDYQDVAQVQDPGQSWNALTVGGYTNRSQIEEENYRRWEPVAPAGQLSPFSATSIAWAPSWPNKPDFVLEAGNAAVDPANKEPVALDDLALLTTNGVLLDRPIVPTTGTSPATAEAARLAAILTARYPNLWPETIRALLVHSAEWTQPMLDSSDNKNHLLRRYGYGVPNLERACWSATNALTLVTQDQLQPFDKTDNGIKTKDMNIHQLPWPRQALQDLGQVDVELRVTLSYFIEPNPARRGWKYKHRYQSCGLRFQVKKAGESLDDFRARVSKDAQDEDEIPFPGDANWRLGQQLRNRGSVHSDLWKGTAADLANRDCLAVFPVTGWWKERAHLERWRESVRYALVVSIRAPEVDVDIYTPVLNMIRLPVEIAG